MLTRNTYLAVFLAVTAATTLSIVSCAPDSTAPRASAEHDPGIALQKVEDLRAKYGWIGQYHSDGLAYMYSALAKGTSKVRSRADACKVAAKALKEFHRAARQSEIPASLVDPSLVNETCGDFPESGPIGKTVLVGEFGGSVRRDELSGTAVNFINEIISAAPASSTKSAFINAVNSIEAQAAVSLSDTEAGAVVAVASIARSSADYWDANLGAWVALPGAMATPYTVAGTTPIKYGFWGSAGKATAKVAGADVVAGARTVFVTWMVGPVGWEAAGVSALWGSGVAAMSLIF